MALKKILGSENCLFEDITEIKNYYNFFSKLSSDDKVVIAGGDGTLNKFINSTDKMKFLNVTGYGIDGYCCEKGDEMRESSDFDNPINYIMIAIKGLLFYYKPTRAEITVDGKNMNSKTYDLRLV